MTREYQFEFNEIKTLTKQVVDDWINRLQNELGWNITYRGAGNDVGTYSKQCKALQNALNAHRAWVLTFGNTKHRARANDIDAIIDTFKRKQREEDDDFFNNFNRERFKRIDPIDEATRDTTRSKFN